MPSRFKTAEVEVFGFKFKKQPVIQNRENCFPSLKEALINSKCDAENLRVALPFEQGATKTVALDRLKIYLSDKKIQCVEWRISSLSELFRGSKKPEGKQEIDHECYLNDLLKIEMAVLLACEFIHEPTDEEFLNIYKLVKRLPDSKSQGFLHDVVFQGVALALGTNPRSVDEFQMILEFLERSVRRFRTGHASRNYIQHLKNIVSPVGELQKKEDDLEAIGRKQLLMRLKTRKSKLAKVPVIDLPAGMPKMSEVLLEFADPLIRSFEESGLISERIYKILIIFSMALWNIALLPEAEQKEQLKDLFSGYSEHTKSFCELLSMCAEQLLKDKKRFFQNDQRFIADFEFSGSGPTLRVDVLSYL